MQELVGIVRNEEEMLRALEVIKDLKSAPIKCELMETVNTTRVAYRPGFEQSVHGLGSHYSFGHRKKESRGAHFREDYPEKDENIGKFNIIVKKAADGEMQVKPEPILRNAADLNRSLRK